MKQLIINFFTLLLFSVSLQAQDFHLSQYDAAALNLNPAMTGMFNGIYRAHMHYRTQWTALTNKPFKTTELAYDTHLKKISVGGQLLDYRAGTGSYNALSLLGSAAYDKAIDSAGNHHISCGAQIGFIYKSFNMANMVFSNQYVPTGGGSFDNSLPSGELNYNQSDFLPDANLGLFYYYTKDQVRLNPFLGFTAFHLSRPNESFYDQNNKLPIRYLIHGGFKINISENIQLTPKIFAMQQANDHEFTYSLMANYYLKESDAFLLLGATLRNRDASIYEVGLRYKGFTYRISYDINTSALKPSTDGRGGFELSVTFIQLNVKPKPTANCPRL